MLIQGNVIALREDEDDIVFRLDHYAASFRVHGVDLQLGKTVNLELPDEVEAKLRDANFVIRNASITGQKKLEKKKVQVTSRAPVRSGEG